MLWFGDERGYNATLVRSVALLVELWFGDERGYNATVDRNFAYGVELWFGDERGYNATRMTRMIRTGSCGLVMKEDITQLKVTQGSSSVVVVW